MFDLKKSQRDTIAQGMASLFNEYDYHYTRDAINGIITRWAEQKGCLIDILSKHPRWNADRLLIAYDVDFDRELDAKAVGSFGAWIMSTASNPTYFDAVPEEVQRMRAEEDCAFLPEKMWEMFYYMSSNFAHQFLTEEEASTINDAFPTINAKAGQKTSRAINKVCAYLGYDKHPYYNREFAKFADGLNPLHIVRHTILSVNPLDYLTMSFGNSWASCHTIDKCNKRGKCDGYSGCYSSGTISYMLDKVSMICYTVDNAYAGDEYYFEDKITRQVFHFGEEKLIQGRLYPQANDGDKEEYKPYRDFVQMIFAECLGLPNLWTLKRGCSAVNEYVHSEGTHYRDYDHFSDCTLSIPQGRENTNYITIGADPMCIECGCTHDERECINCCTRPDDYRCEECGDWVDADEVVWVNNHCYCSNCVELCEHCQEYVSTNDVRYLDGVGYVCYECEDSYTMCDRCETYHLNEDTLFDEESGDYLCPHCRGLLMRERQAEASAGEWRVVSRPVRAGDYIRLIDVVFSFNTFGDILPVFAVRGDVARVRGCDHPIRTHRDDDEYLWNYFPSNYEVVECVEKEDAE